MNLKILYRGHVSDCNYSCPYCPFSNTRNDAVQRGRDRGDLLRFLDWVDDQGAMGWRLEILFTPYGEALVHPWYREAMVRLSRTACVAKVAAQTNLSWNPAWVADLDPAKAAFWATFHPGQAREELFSRKCRELSRMGVRHSVGVVGLKEHFAAIARLRDALPASTYLWVNAYKRRSDYYGDADIRFLASIDPYFRHNLQYYPTFGRDCATGSEVVAIEGNGDLHRCHFAKGMRGNIFGRNLQELLRREPCPVPTCHCHIGYVHVPHLDLASLYGEGILERIPASWV